MLFRWVRNWKRKKIKEQQIPVQWIELIKNRFPYFLLLPGNDQQELLGHVQVFLAEKFFEGCEGLFITEEMKVVIAAQACILLLHRNDAVHLIRNLDYVSAWLFRLRSWLRQEEYLLYQP